MHSKKLIEKLSELNIETVGDLFYVSYNSPIRFLIDEMKL